MKNLNLFKELKKQYQLLMFVFAAFVSVAVISFYYANIIIDKEVNETGATIVSLAEAELETILNQTEAMLNSASYSVLEMQRNGADSSEIASYLKDLSAYMSLNQINLSGVTGIYGYINGNYISSGGEDPEKAREAYWYQSAMADGDVRVIYSSPPVDAETGASPKLITLSKKVYDNADTYGVLAVDIRTEFLNGRLETALKGDPPVYAFVINRNDNIIIHPDSALAMQHMRSISEPKRAEALVRRIKSATALTGEPFVDYNRIRSFGSFKIIHNGWIVGVAIPSGGYYTQLYSMMFVLLFLGIIVFLTIGCFLLILVYERMRSEKENKNKTSFLAKMSHEIRTPLNAVLGMSELILREDIPHNIYEHAVSIKQSSTNLISIINDILDFSKIESEKLEIVNTDYIFSSLIYDVISIIRVRLLDKPIKLVVNIDSIIPNKLFGDEVRIRQVLINLLSNAVKYTKEGTIAISITGAKRDGRFFDFVMEIKDTGIGIKDEDKAKLFGEFQQINLEANKDVEGTGLGLAISKNICRALGGDISVSSVFGKGSVFTAKITQIYKTYEKFAEVKEPEATSVILYETRENYAESLSRAVKNLKVTCKRVKNQNEFYEELKRTGYEFAFVSSFLFSSVKNIVEKLSVDLKIVLIAEYGEHITIKCHRIIEMPSHCIAISKILNNVEEDTGHHHGFDSGARFVAPSANVLIVDDITTNLKVAEGLMSPYGMKVDVCKSGAEAIESVKSKEYDIVFMDHMMPGMDGIETTGKIRAMPREDGYYQNMPIIALTAVAISGVKEMFTQNGMNDFLAKPIEVAKLNAILERWIPKEKQEKISISSGTDKGSVNFEIDGVDAKIGMSMAGGNYDTYIRILDVFHKDCLEKTEEITAALEANDIGLYTTHVHALKSALANIGALKVSEFARSLESAGKNEDVNYITENNNEFVHGLRKLSSNVEAVLLKFKEENTQTTQNDDISKLTEGLNGLKTALSTMDIGAVDTVIAGLQSLKWSSGVKDGIEKVAHLILMFEYAEAIEMIDEVLSSVNQTA